MQCHADDVKNACKETVQLNLVFQFSVLLTMASYFVSGHTSLFSTIFLSLGILKTKHSYQLLRVQLV